MGQEPLRRLGSSVSQRLLPFQLLQEPPRLRSSGGRRAGTERQAPLPRSLEAEAAAEILGDEERAREMHRSTKRKAGPPPWAPHTRLCHFSLEALVPGQGDQAARRGGGGWGGGAGGSMVSAQRKG